jgi:hypothetical protein
MASEVNGTLLRVNILGWVVNWLCMIMLFFGLVILGRNLSTETQRAKLADERSSQQRTLLQEAVLDLKKKLDQTSPTDVMKEVLEIKRMLEANHELLNKK